MHREYPPIVEKFEGFERTLIKQHTSAFQIADDGYNILE